MASRAAASAARMQVISVTSAVRAGRTATSSSTSTASRNLSSNVQTGGQAQFQHTQHTQHKHTQQEGGLSTLGTLFFGSLCASTFGLGVWQSRRYFEKIDQVERRTLELAADPVELDRFTITAAAAANDDDDDGDDSGNTTEDSATARTTASYRRLITRGEFMHDDEVLVGPRGPPPGALASSGPSSGRSSGGMASSPQVRNEIFVLLRVHICMYAFCYFALLLVFLCSAHVWNLELRPYNIYILLILATPYACCSFPSFRDTLSLRR